MTTLTESEILRRARGRDLRTWDSWRDVHQQFELNWWREAIARGHSVDDAGFRAFWDEVGDFVCPQGSVLDIGCGPRPPFAPCSVIEPLADEYRKFTPDAWWRDVVAHAVPAEQRVDDLRADTVICWNCIDHAVGWREILDNVVHYLRDSEYPLFAVATDLHEPFVGHPGFSREEFEAEIEKRFTVTARREPFGRDVALLATPRC